MGSPLILISLLTVWSGVITALNWHKTPEKVPVWWDLQGNCSLSLSLSRLVAVELKNASGFGFLLIESP
jgi:hypothetical protein